MIRIIKELNVEVTKPNIFQAIVAKQYDMNTRFLKVTFVDCGQRIEIPNVPTAKVIINAERKDGQSKGFDGEINEDGTVTVPLHSWMLELDGTVICDISVIDTETDDNKKLTTTSFTLLVEKAAYGGDDVTSDPQYDVLVGLIGEIETKLANGEFKGDKGDTGEQGPQGIQGPKGDKGDPGDVNLEYLHNGFANAIKNNRIAKGVKLKDVSPIEHDLKIKVRPKNLFDGELKIWSNLDRIMPTKCIKVKPNTWHRISVYDYTIQHPLFAIYGNHTGIIGLSTDTLIGNMATTFNSGEFEYIWFRQWYSMTEDGITLESKVQVEEIANQTAPGTAYTPYVDVSTVKVYKYGKNICSNNYTDYADTKYKSFYLGEGNLVMSLKDKKPSVDVSGCYIGFAVDPDDVNAGYRWVVDNGTIKTQKNNMDSYNEKRCPYLIIFPSNEATFNKLMEHWYIQVEGGTTPTGFEPYKPRQIATVTTEGIVEGFKSVSPNMTLLTDTEDVVMDIDYNIDTKTYIDNKFAELQALILEG